ncbi:MarR family winged helix-turn-helix transcriptional regulator [Frondihabitans australicus]|uniref:DNA-binding MarR family transcriptional regulator n=1 Tax=Frondihabitans australicus TaxID=386892 RepID=A0A495IB39_9MICO|nr:MarR family transcriptional regulator [Frondihabitans australicus]RKR73132.1 DNA-binding MarR family transcriptional regulator [Frondihabitans australicus]
MPEGNRPARIGFALSQLGALAAGIFAAETAALGVTPAEAGVVRIIGRSPGLSQRELAERLGTVQSRVVALVDGLERGGHVSRARSATDRRVQELDLTPSGRTLLSALRRAAERQDVALTEGLAPEDVATLAALLARLTAARALDPAVHPAYRPRASAE